MMTKSGTATVRDKEILGIDFECLLFYLMHVHSSGDDTDLAQYKCGRIHTLSSVVPKCVSCFGLHVRLVSEEAVLP